MTLDNLTTECGEHPAVCKPKDVAQYLRVSVRVVLRYDSIWGFPRLSRTSHRVHYRTADVLRAFPPAAGKRDIRPD